jgi:hypothetical protein
LRFLDGESAIFNRGIAYHQEWARGKAGEGIIVAMPTVKIIGRHRFYFFSKENNEPPHIHVESAENAAKFWLFPIELDWAVGYNSKELRQIRELVEEHVEFFLEKWYEQPKNT